MPSPGARAEPRHTCCSPGASSQQALVAPQPLPSPASTAPRPPPLSGRPYGTPGPVSSCVPESGSAVRKSEGWAVGPPPPATSRGARAEPRHTCCSPGASSQEALVAPQPLPSPASTAPRPPPISGRPYGTPGPVSPCVPESGSAVRKSERWRGGGTGPPRPTRVRRPSRSAGILQELLVAQGDEVLAGGGEAVEGVAAVLVVLLDEQVLGARLDGGVDDLAPLQGALPHLGELHDPGECLHEALDVAALQHVESLGP